MVHLKFLQLTHLFQPSHELQTAIWKEIIKFPVSLKFTGGCENDNHVNF